MSIKTKLLGGLLLIGVVFGAGFLLAYRQVVELEAELNRLEGSLSTAQGTIDGLGVEIRMAELRDLAGLMYLETTKHNYELAAGYSTRFFNGVAEAANTLAPPLGPSLKPLLEKRDSVDSHSRQGQPGGLE